MIHDDLILFSESKNSILENEDMQEILTNKKNFMKYLDNRRDDSVIDSAISFCEETGIDIESIANIIKNNDVLLSKITIEAENINMIERIDRLPI